MAITDLHHIIEIYINVKSNVNVDGTLAMLLDIGLGANDVYLSQNLLQGIMLRAK